MEYNGFASIRAYERECARNGYHMERVPYHDRNGGKFFVLITCPPRGSDSCCFSWHLFTADEDREVMDGVVSGGDWMDRDVYLVNGVDVNYEGKLTAAGYFPDSAYIGPVPERPPLNPLARMVRDETAGIRRRCHIR